MAVLFQNNQIFINNNLTINNSSNFDSGKTSLAKTVITGLFLSSLIKPAFSLQSSPTETPDSYTSLSLSASSNAGKIPNSCFDQSNRAWKEENAQWFKTYTSLECPILDFNFANPDQLAAMKILTNPSLQNILMDHPCPYGTSEYTSYSQEKLLWRLTNDHEARSQLTDEVLQQLDKLEKYNKDLPPTVSYPCIYSKIDILLDISKEKLDVSKLFQSQRTSSFEDPFLIKMMKAIQGISLAEPGDKDVAVILWPQSDWNGAFGKCKINNHRHTWKEISKKFPIHFEEVSNYGEVYAVMDKVKQIYANIKMIQISGHGDGETLELGEENLEKRYIVNPNNFQEFQINPKYPFFAALPFNIGQPIMKKEQLKEVNLDETLEALKDSAFKLEPDTPESTPSLFMQAETLKSLPIDSDGVIILSGCSSGKGGKEATNLVNTIAYKHPGVTVVGLLRDAAGLLRVNNLDRMEFSILDDLSNNEDVTYQAKIPLIPPELYSLYSLLAIFGIGAKTVDD